MVEAISMAILKKVLPVIVKKTGESAQKKYHELRAKVANGSHEYDKNYRERHGQFKVFCVGMREPIPLDDVYVAVQFLDQVTGANYRSREDLERAFRQRHPDERQGKRQDGTQVANDKQYLMVLGAPGVGKSTFLRKIGLEALKEEEGNFAHECIPVFLELKRFTEDQNDIEALIGKEFEICGYPYPEEIARTALESGNLLILFDGLDEVPTANVDNVIRKIGDFVDRYRQNRFIASCRIAAYTGGFTRFTDVEMAAFDDLQVKAYINNWFTSTSDSYRRQLDEEMKTSEQCWEALNQGEHKATKELARNPLLLTLLCMVYDNSQNFPRNRADLYEDALNIFLKEWAAEKRVPRDSSVSQYLDISAEKRMLSEIAAKNFEVNRFLFNENELINQIKAFGRRSANTPPTFNPSKILEIITVEQGLFVERISRFYSFSHLTFQEYLTANYIAGNARSIKGLVTDHLHHDGWQEVFLLTAGLMREADHLLEQMQDEATKFINTDRLKALFQWATCITTPSGCQYDGIAKRIFAIRQYFYLWLLNKIYELPQNIANRPFYLKRDLHIDNEKLASYIELYSDLYLYRDLSLNRNLYVDIEPYLNLDIAPHIELYIDLEINFHSDFNLYQDLYGYMEIDLYPIASSEFDNQLNSEMDRRIPLVEQMEQAKIFKGVDLQRMAQKFNEERKSINAAREGKVVTPPEESIHDTWLSVLGITDDMLAISREEMEDYIHYLHVVKLIVACKEAAGRVTPEIWKKIEDRLLTWDGEDIDVD